MRVTQRQSNDHVVIGRAIADKTIVVAREPQLIKLGLPLPSVPILSPLLSPIVGGSNSNQNSGSGSGSGSTPTTPAAPPAQTTNSGGSSGSSGGSSGGSTGGGSSTSNPGNGGSSGGGGGTSSGGSSSSSGGSSSGGSSSSGGTSSGNTSSSGGAASSGSSSDTGSGSASSSGTDSGSSSGDTSATGSGTSSSSSSSQGGSGTSSTPGGVVLSGGGSANSTTSSNGGPDSNSGDTQKDGGSGGGSSSGGIANAGGIPGASSGSSVHSTNGKGIPNSTQAGGNSAATSVGGISSAGSDNGNSGSSKHGLSGGAIAGISICLLALLVAIIIFLVRRRTRSRRDDQTRNWWFTSKRGSQTYGDRNSKEILAPGVRTARSSFATTVDQSNRSHREDSPIPRNSFIIPPLPPMAEIGRANGTTPALALTIDTSHSASTPAIIEKRISTSSRLSAETSSEYLVIHHRDSLNPGTPMSVRPFSPSESFAFPRPPDPVGDRNSAYSRPSSSGTLAMMQAGTHFSFHSSTIPPTPCLPTLIVNQDSPINNVSDPFADNNPFDNPVSAEPTNATGHAGFAETEFICRPFVPTLHDELAVRPDDPVRMLKTFDDGWALVEKIRPDTNEVIERGLIPIDCLRAPGQALPAFFAAKRVSSYAGSVVEVHAF